MVTRSPAQMADRHRVPARSRRHAPMHVVIACSSLAAADPSAAQTLAISPAQRAEVDRSPPTCTPKVVETRRDIHRHPELGYRETRTAALVADRLRALGFDEVRTGVGMTGVVGILKGGRPGKVVAVRADMDALPIPELIDVPYKSTVDEREARLRPRRARRHRARRRRAAVARARPDARHGADAVPARRGRRSRRRPHRRAADARRRAVRRSEAERDLRAARACRRSTPARSG